MKGWEEEPLRKKQKRRNQAACEQNSSVGKSNAGKGKKEKRASMPMLGDQETKQNSSLVGGGQKRSW